jgi:subtilisin family serine protease
MARRVSRKTSHARSADHAAAAGEDHQSAPRRFVISQLLSLHPAGQLRTDAAEVFNNRLERVLLPSVDVVSSVSSETARAESERAPGSLRRVLVVEGDAAELSAKGAEMTSDTVIEPELLRVPAKAYPAELQMASLVGAQQQGPGTGAELKLTLQGASGAVAAGATVLVRFDAVQRLQASVSAGGVSDNSGNVSVAFDPNLWRPTMVGIEPTGDLWTAVVRMPQSGQVVQLQELPKTGPLGWWHLLSGETTFDPDAGKSIKVGVIDSGVGPHPYLEHVTPVGAFLEGSFLSGVTQGRDVQTHGTHVSGIIGARPPADSQEFSGVAPGADLYVGRVFSESGGGNQGDVANAIDALSTQYAVDIINMSLTGAPSSIEHDAVILAFQKGTVCVCAAGNQTGSAIGYPAAYPESIAVSALGLINTAPPDTMPALNAPSQADRYGYGGIFLASFSNIGPQMFCAAPGNGIISTIPANKQNPAPYADMSGTSMASPLVAGILADLLARDAQYAAMERSAARAAYAKMLLARHALSILLNRIYQGQGMPRVI